MKLAMVVQRYGTEVLGGAEYLCRLLAERFATQHDVEVLTTCARDYITWKNEYPEGTDRVRGVTVRRFANAQTRDIKAFNEYSDWIFNNPHSRQDEMEWLKRQGPWCPALIEYLRRNHQQYDALIFMTYLYAPTVIGLEVCAGRSLLIPTAHDEPAAQLEIYKDVFARAAALVYNTESEARFVRGRFSDRPLLEDVVGVGVDLPQPQPYPRMPSAAEFESATETGRAESADLDSAGIDSADSESTPSQSTATEPATERSVAADPTAAAAPNGGDATPGDDVLREFPSHLLARGAVFRRRHRLHGPILLYGGRIDPGKGCEELIEYFRAYVQDGGDATLALMGVKLMPLPDEPFVRFAGLLSDRERVQALEAATVVACPSPYESLSLLALEAFAVGTPVLANARSEVLVEHCVKSNAGLYYANKDEFVECLSLLVKDARLRAAMGRNGRDYVRRNYRWDVIMGKYDRLFAKVRNAR